MEEYGNNVCHYKTFGFYLFLSREPKKVRWCRLIRQLKFLELSGCRLIWWWSILEISWCRLIRRWKYALSYASLLCAAWIAESKDMYLQFFEVLLLWIIISVYTLCCRSPFPRSRKGRRVENVLKILIISIKFLCPANSFSDVKMAAALLNASCQADRMPQNECDWLAAFRLFLSRISFLAMCVVN